MPKRNPNRVIVEQCHRFRVRDLITKHRMIRPGQITTFHIHPLPFQFRAFLDADWERGWLEIVGGVGTRWEICRRPVHHLKHLWDGYDHYFLIGHTDKTPCRELLITKDLTRAGSRLDLAAHHQSTHADSRSRRLRKRHAICCQLLILENPANLTKLYVPRDGGAGIVEETNERGRWWEKWWERLTHSRPDVVIVPVSRPPGIDTSHFHKLLDKLNAHHIRAGKIQRLDPSPASTRSPAPRSRRQQAGAGDVDGAGVIGWMESVFNRRS